MIDREAFCEQARQAERSLYRIARNYLSSDADCADAVQDALCSAWKNRASLREERYFRTWLTRILINVCKRTLRKHKTLSTIPLNEQISQTSPPQDTALYETLFMLKKKYRIVLVLFYLDGYAVDDISRMLSLPRGTVKSQLHRARKLMKTAYHNEEMFADDEA